MRFLLIEDDPDHAYFTTDAIHEGYDKKVTVDWETKIQAGLDRLQQHHYDIVLCDLNLPDSDIEATIDRLRSLEIATPIIVLTSLNDQETAKSLICQGIQDYLPKEDLSGDLLRRVCTYAIERKKQTVLLQNKNRDQALFCYSLSNDFKGPIRRIASLVEVLKEDLEGRVAFTDDDRACFDGIQRNIDSINTLVMGLFQYLNLEVVGDDFDEVDLNEVVDEVKKTFVGEKGIAAEINCSALPTIEANRGQMILLLKNIIDNGIKFNGEAPVISIDGGIDDEDSQCILSVADNGIGIERENREKIFEPFFCIRHSERQEGSGLGLCIAKRIVDCHGGQIRVDSEYGHGSVFKIALPRCQNCAEE